MHNCQKKTSIRYIDYFAATDENLNMYRPSPRSFDISDRNKKRFKSSQRIE